MLCWMHDNEMHRGFAELPTGAPMLESDIVARVGKSPKEVKACLEEMGRIGTFSRDSRGCIYSRRMARDTHISEVRRAAAKSRAATSKRAADGSFIGDFAPPKDPAKEEQTPDVKDTASASVSATTSSQQQKVAPVLPRLPCQSEYPLTTAAVRNVKPATDDMFIVRLVQEVVQFAISKNLMEYLPDITDEAIAAAVSESWHSGPKNHGTGLLLKTVPQIIATWAVQN